MSNAPPAVNPTTMRTGRDGYACAQAMRPAAGPAAAPPAKCRNRRRASFIAFPRGSLVIQASAQLTKWNHHVLAVCLTFLEAIVPRLYMRKGRTLDVQSEIAKQRSASGNIGQTERVTTQEPPICEHHIQQLKMAGTPRNLLANGRPVSLRFRGPIEAPKDAHEKIGL